MLIAKLRSDLSDVTSAVEVVTESALPQTSPAQAAGGKRKGKEANVNCAKAKKQAKMEASRAAKGPKKWLAQRALSRSCAGHVRG